MTRGFGEDHRTVAIYTRFKQVKNTMAGRLPPGRADGPRDLKGEACAPYLSEHISAAGASKLRVDRRGELFDQRQKCVPRRPQLPTLAMPTPQDQRSLHAIKKLVRVLDAAVPYCTRQPGSPDRGRARGQRTRPGI